MSEELRYLTWVTIFTGVLWVPYIVNNVFVRGLPEAVGYPANPKPLSPWAMRLKAAHYNAVENLVIFATLVLVANAIGAHSENTVLACLIYFWARVVHALSYTMAIPMVRTLAFVVGVLCQGILAWVILCS